MALCCLCLVLWSLGCDVNLYFPVMVSLILCFVVDWFDTTFCVCVLLLVCLLLGSRFCVCV